MATQFSIPAWRIPGTEKPSGLQSTRSQASDMTEVTWRACIYGEEIYSTELFTYINQNSWTVKVYLRTTIITQSYYFSETTHIQLKKVQFLKMSYALKII